MMKVRKVTRDETYEFESYDEMLRMYAVANSMSRIGWQRFWRAAPFLIGFMREVRIIRAACAQADAA